ncbi:MAG: hypothetical protein ACI84K_000386 [Pseudohongiellaceae bacterium]|jgi:hypothetical protein
MVVPSPPYYTNESCTECDHKESADEIGAKNELARGHRVLACGGPV